MGIKEFFDRQIEKKRRFKEAEQEFLIRKKIEERQKSPNERELEHFIEAERQKKINNNLTEFRKREKEKMFHDNIFNGGNIFKNQRINFLE